MFFPVDYNGRKIFLPAFDPAEFDSEAYALGHQAGKTEGIEEGINEGYAQGLTDGRMEATGDAWENGRAEAEALCTSKHYAEKRYGDGNTTITVEFPFRPDVISITAVDQAVAQELNGSTLLQLHILPFGDAERFGSGAAMADAQFALIGLTTEKASDRMEIVESGGKYAVTLKNIEYYKTGRYAVFATGVEYLIVAAKG